eukprot:CAMPEP_0117429186 /NCGR_PEP_ID=MMETSP0758-20121206/8759_1 /TAXON_ID=63605 /ORGANISM="Percolomonas cosmopolitus, Strain AE-1 (ATCC 50343)" /LENGTH=704 /DNA_ID=CAMNT_0005216021 /DNA_START=754 /DNA_END=2864 /DNA_ORIENTATION=-
MKRFGSLIQHVPRKLTLQRHTIQLKQLHQLFYSTVPHESDIEDKPPPPEIIKKYNTLIQKIEEQQDAYYNMEDDTVMQDISFDTIYKLLVNLERDYPTLKNHASPTQMVGVTTIKGPISSSKHNPPMLSLKNAISLSDIKRFLKRIAKKNGDDVSDTTPDLFLENKFDGVAVTLHFDEDGQFKHAYTRGNGTEGHDITTQVQHLISNLPERLSYNPQHKSIEVRGEIVMHEDAFEHLNTISKRTYSNKRNTVAGMLHKRVCEEETKGCCLFYAYALINHDAEGLPVIKSQRTQLKQCESYGFDIDTDAVYIDADWTDFENEQALDLLADRILEAVNEKKEDREESSIDFDGVVLKCCDPALRDILGDSTKHPNWAIAYKFEPPSAVATLESIEWKPASVKGIMTPMAVLEPSVIIDGKKIKTASLHNLKSMFNERLYELGDMVSVELAGDVIPKVRALESNDLPSRVVSEIRNVMNLEVGQTMEFDDFVESMKPLHCGCSLNSTCIHVDMDTGVVTCEDPSCPPQQVAAYVHLAKAFSFKTWQGKTISLLLDHEVPLQSMYAILTFPFKDHFESNGYPAGFKEKRVDKLMEARERVIRDPSFTPSDRFATLMHGFNLCGKQTAIKYVNYPQTQKLLDKFRHSLLNDPNCLSEEFVWIRPDYLQSAISGKKTVQKLLENLNSNPKKSMDFHRCMVHLLKAYDEAT